MKDLQNELSTWLLENDLLEAALVCWCADGMFTLRL